MGPQYVPQVSEGYLSDPDDPLVIYKCNWFQTLVSYLLGGLLMLCVECELVQETLSVGVYCFASVISKPFKTTVRFISLHTCSLLFSGPSYSKVSQKHPVLVASLENVPRVYWAPPVPHALMVRPGREKNVQIAGTRRLCCGQPVLCFQIFFSCVFLGFLPLGGMVLGGYKCPTWVQMSNHPILQ